MATQTQTATAPKAELTVEREDSEAARALRRRAGSGQRGAGERAQRVDRRRLREPPRRIESAGRIGARQGKVSELTVIVPFVPGGAKRLRALLQLLDGNLSPGGPGRHRPRHALRVPGQRHEVALRDGLSTATGTPISTTSSRKIPDYHGPHGSACEGCPGIRSPGGERLDRQAPDPGRRLVRRQSESDVWRRPNGSKRVGKAVDEFLDKIG